MLVGEAAYVLDAAACCYVLRGDRHRRGTTLGQLQVAALADDLSSGQLQRWERFRAFLRSKGWSVSDACATSTVIKDRCHQGRGKEEAHSTAERRSAVTLPQLFSMATQEVPAELLGDIRDFLQLIACFGEPGSPLQLGDVVALVDTASV